MTVLCLGRNRHTVPSSWQRSPGVLLVLALWMGGVLLGGCRQPGEPGIETEGTGPSRPALLEESQTPQTPGAPEAVKGPKDPVKPEEPEDPKDPVKPEEPKSPKDPVKPEEPKGPKDPVKPEESKDPEDPEEPQTPGGEPGEIPLALHILILSGLAEKPLRELPAEGIRLSWSGSGGLGREITLNLEGYQRVICRVDGKALAADPRGFTIKAAEYTTAVHYISLSGMKGGVPYGWEIPFMVVH